MVCVPVVVLTVLAVAAAGLAENTVTLKQGQLRGRVLESRKGRPIYSFQGIPYAKPPLGDLRFKAPQPPEPWEGVLDATKERSICVQRGFFPTDVNLRGDEDCLFLNVYTPQQPTGGEFPELWAVMFWIHGGGWFAGSGDTDFYGPEYLLDKNVLLVTINYRLGALGFLSTEDEECPGNSGLKDQLAALRWVRDNIAAFGGDPANVTIFGESAGGASVHFHMLSPVSKGLFHRAIAQSGNAFTPWSLTPPGDARRLAHKTAGLFDCPTESSSELLACLRKQDAYDVFGVDHKLPEAQQTLLLFRPVVEVDNEEAFMTEHPFETLRSGKPELVPWMTGFTSSEASYFLQFLAIIQQKKDFSLEDSFVVKDAVEDPQNTELVKLVVKKLSDFYYKDVTTTEERAAASINILSDVLFVGPTNTAVKMHSKLGSTVYYYIFDHLGSDSFNHILGDPKTYQGVSHLDDVIYLFPQVYAFPNASHTAADEKMVDFMVTLWTNFARRGTPTPTWKAVTSPEALEFARLDAEALHVGRGPMEAREALWDSLPVRNQYPHSHQRDEL